MKNVVKRPVPQHQEKHTVKSGPLDPFNQSALSVSHKHTHKKIYSVLIHL